MKRRVIKQGNNTLTITLPRKWAEKFNVKVGDELEVEEKVNSLIINCQKEISLNKIKLDLDNLSPLINRTLLKIYEEGYDEVELSYSKSELAQNIRPVLNECIGFEIIQQGNKTCTIKDISGILNFDFKTMLRRLFLILKGILEDSYIFLQNSDFETLKNITFREFEVNKLSHVCLRYLNKKNDNDIKEAFNFYLVVYLLELIGDDYKYFFDLILKKEIKLNDSLLKNYQKLNIFFNEVYTFVFDNTNKQKAVEASRNHIKLKQELNTLGRNDIQIIYFRLILEKMIYILGTQLGKLNET
ncbi:MAG: phosphate uptake regulator PhoU [Nanoarchaeota archaeon]